MPAKQRFGWKKAVAIAGAAALGAAAQGQGSVSAARAQVETALRSSGAAKAGIAEVYAATGRFPDDAKSAGIEGPMQTLEFQMAVGAGGIITITFREAADVAIRGKIIKLVPMNNASEDVVWYCLAPALPMEAVPERCRWR